jgi:hypothetical protein
VNNTFVGVIAVVEPPKFETLVRVAASVLGKNHFAVVGKLAFLFSESNSPVW